MAAPIRIHCLMHVPFEGPAIIGEWTKKNRAVITFTRFYKNDALPDPSQSDIIVIMGGPMNVYDFHLNSWMEEEIGWHNLQFLPALAEYRICRELPASRKVFHWHGDTFHLPRGSTLIASSRAFTNQGFIYKNTLAFQFHLEVTPGSVGDLVENCRDDLIPGPHVQTELEILDEQRYYQPNQELMFRFLDYLRGFI